MQEHGTERSRARLNYFELFSEAKALIPVQKSYQPRRQHQQVYDRTFEAFKALYDNNKRLFRTVNS